MLFFDWYQCTFHDVSREKVINELVYRLDLVDVTPGKGKNGYSRAVDIKRGSHVVASVMWDGNPGVHVLATGQDADEVAGIVRGIGPHAVTRVDCRQDFVLAGLFDQLADDLRKYATTHNISIDMRGDWTRGQARTLYLGSRQGDGQIVLYEKGYESGGSHDWVRMECRAYPKKEARYNVAKWPRRQVMCATRWMRAALDAINYETVAHASIGKMRQKRDDEKTRAALIDQYGATLETWADEVGGFEQLGNAIAELIEKKRRHQNNVQLLAAGAFLDLLGNRWGRADGRLHVRKVALKTFFYPAGSDIKLGLVKMG